MKYKTTFGLTVIGLLLISGCLFFFCDGADAEIKLNPPPAHWKVAPKLMREWKDRKLLSPSEEIPGFPSDAIVVLACLEQTQSGVAARFPMVGFVIGDGTLILTAAHCVVEDHKADMVAARPQAVVISPYYGDIFDFEIVAMDIEADLAILKAPWPAHPALALASEDDLKKAKHLLAVGYPPSEVKNFPKEKLKLPYTLHQKLSIEKIPSHFKRARRPDKAIILEGTRFIGPGWSGSAIVLPETGEVVGVVCNLSFNRGNVVTKVFGLPLIRRKDMLTRRDASGCGVAAIRALLKQNGLESAAYQKPAKLKPVENAEMSFSMAMEHLEAYLNSDLDKAVSVAKKLVELRPQSVHAHLFLANSASHVYQGDTSKKDILALAEANFKEALHLCPDSADAHSYYANFLIQMNQYDKALPEIEKALSIDAGNKLAMTNKLKILSRKEPAKAAEVGRLLTEEYPDNAQYWLSYCDVLIVLKQNEEALKAVEKAIGLNPDGLYEGRLAKALEGVDRLDEAEENFRKMTKDCACQRCLFQYSRFLITHRNDKLDEAENVLDLAVECKKDGGVSKRNFADLRYSLVRVKFENIGKESPEKAEAMARELLEKEPENAQYWFELAGVLRTLDRLDEALEAAQNAVDLAPEQSYRPRLANILAKAGQLDTAEQTYNEMLDEHPERAKYWFWYAEYLNEYRPDRINDAQAALSKAESPDKSWAVPAEELRELRDKLHF